MLNFSKLLKKSYLPFAQVSQCNGDIDKVQMNATKLQILNHGIAVFFPQLVDK